MLGLHHFRKSLKLVLSCTLENLSRPSRIVHDDSLSLSLWFLVDYTPKRSRCIVYFGNCLLFSLSMSWRDPLGWLWSYLCGVLL